MHSVKRIHSEPKGSVPHDKKFPRKALPPDRQFSTAKEHMKVRRDLARYNRIAKEVNAIVEKVENGQESAKALVSWARSNQESLPENVRAMLRYFVVAHDSTQKEFYEKHPQFAALADIAGSMSDGAHAKDPSVLATVIESGKEVARLGTILFQTREELEGRIGKLQAKIASAN